MSEDTEQPQPAKVPPITSSGGGVIGEPPKEQPPQVEETDDA